MCWLSHVIMLLSHTNFLSPPTFPFKTLILFNFWVRGPSPAWILVWRVAQTFKAFQRGHLTCVRGHISHRIRFMSRRTFFYLEAIAFLEVIFSVRESGSHLFCFLDYYYPIFLNLHISGISQAYIRHRYISGISQIYLRYISDISHVYLSYILWISQVYLKYI